MYFWLQFRNSVLASTPWSPVSSISESQPLRNSVLALSMPCSMLSKKTCYYSVTWDLYQSHSNWWLFDKGCTESKGKNYSKKWSILTNRIVSCQPIWIMLVLSMSPIWLTNIKRINAIYLFVYVWMNHPFWKIGLSDELHLPSCFIVVHPVSFVIRLFILISKCFLLVF